MADNAPEFTPELDQATLDALLRRIQEQYGQQVASAKGDATARGLTGSTFESSRLALADKFSSTATADALTNFAVQKANMQREERLARENREFQAAENEKQRVFQGGQAGLDREFSDTERRLAEQYNALEAEKQRAYASGEGEKARTYEAQQNELNRQYQDAQSKREAKQAILNQVGSLAGNLGGAYILGKAGTAAAGKTAAASAATSGGTTAAGGTAAGGTAAGGTGAAGSGAGSGGSGASGLGTAAAALGVGLVARNAFEKDTIGGSFGLANRLADPYSGTSLKNVVKNTAQDPSKLFVAETATSNLFQNIIDRNPNTGLAKVLKVGQNLNPVNSVKKIFCFLAGTPVMMINGKPKPIEQVEVGDDLKGGRVISVRKSEADDLYDYFGVKVTGEHAVKENNVWIRVKNSKDSLMLGPGTRIVYSIVTENHRMYVPSSVGEITFADEHETDHYETMSIDESLEHLNKLEGWRAS